MFIVSARTCLSFITYDVKRWPIGHFFEVGQFLKAIKKKKKTHSKEFSLYLSMVKENQISSTTKHRRLHQIRHTFNLWL